MGDYVEAGKTGDFEGTTRKKVSVQGRDILLVRVNDRFYAADNLCPHMGADLSAGSLEGAIITCPRHGSRFDLSNGKVVRWLKGSGLVSAIGKALKSPRPLKTYNVKVEGDTILIEV